MTTAGILQSFSHTTGKQHTSPIDSNKIQQDWNLLEYVGKMTSLSTKLQRTPIIIRLSETMWKYRLGLASNQHVPGRMLTLDWTIIQSIAPNNKPPTGKVKITFGNTKIYCGISRADIADFNINY